MICIIDIVVDGLVLNLMTILMPSLLHIIGIAMHIVMPSVMHISMHIFSCDYVHYCANVDAHYYEHVKPMILHIIMHSL